MLVAKRTLLKELTILLTWAKRIYHKESLKQLKSEFPLILFLAWTIWINLLLPKKISPKITLVKEIKVLLELSTTTMMWKWVLRTYTKLLVSIKLLKMMKSIKTNTQWLQTGEVRSSMKILTLQMKTMMK